MDITLLVPILRQILQMIGGILIARGYLDEGSAEALIGIIVNGLAFAWWAFDRIRINRKNAAVKEVAKEAVGHDAVKEVVDNA